jgi:hypothetical protein
MSRQNKVNPDHYKTAGRLSPDDLAREQQKQRASATTPAARRKSLARGKAAPAAKPRTRAALGSGRSRSR